MSNPAGCQKLNPLILVYTTLVSPSPTVLLVKYKIVTSMTGTLLGGRSISSKHQIAYKSSNSHSNHNPAVVSHKHEPVHIYQYSYHQIPKGYDLHKHKCIEVLQCIQDRLDNVRPLGSLNLITSCPPQRRTLSNGSIHIHLSLHSNWIRA